MHICYQVCARALGLVPPNPRGPHTPARAHTHTHTHTCLLHTLAASHTVSRRGQRQGPPSSHPPLTHRPMSEQVLESAATAAWAKAWGPQWTRCRETTTAGTMIASASPSPSRTRLTTAPRPWAMAGAQGRGEAGGQEAGRQGGAEGGGRLTGQGELTDSQATGQVDHQTGATDRQVGGQPDGRTEEDQTDRVGWVDRQRFPDDQQAAGWTVGVWTDGWPRGCSVFKRPLQRQSWPPAGTSSFSLYLGPGKMPGNRAFMGSFSFQREVSSCC